MTITSTAPIFNKPPRVSEGIFIGVAWTGVGLATVLFTIRVWARIHLFRRLFLDDLFVGLALLMFLTSTILWQIYKGDLYENLEVSAGLIYPPPPNLASNTEEYLRASVPIIIFFYSSLWFIKFSFLSLFRRLGLNVQAIQIQWWIITGITVASWLCSIGTLEYPCLTGNFAFLQEFCTDHDHIEFQRRTLTYNMCMDVITDAMIMTIPFTLLWNVRISLQHKLALLGIFSLTIIIMIFAIVRVAVITSLSFMPDESWLYLWSSIEQTVSIMIACFASYRSIFVKQDATGPSARTKSNSDSSAKRFTSASNFFKILLPKSRSTHARISDQDDGINEYMAHSGKKPSPYYQDTKCTESRTHIISLQQIRVSKDFRAVSNSTADKA